jgi:hypothetical protein
MGSHDGVSGDSDAVVIGGLTAWVIASLGLLALIVGQVSRYPSPYSVVM